MRNVIVLSLVVASGALAFACGDDDDDKKSENGGDADAGISAGRDSGAGGAKDGGASCDPMDQMEGTEECTPAQLKVYSDCVDTACSDEYTKCYGPGYKQGKFSGVCGTYLNCTQDCDCNDSACQAACNPSSECETCLQSFASCASSCISKLQCAFGDSGVALGDKTCADLLTCCNSLTDADQKTDCKDTHAQIVMSGGGVADLVCSGLYTTYCP